MSLAGPNTTQGWHTLGSGMALLLGTELSFHDSSSSPEQPLTCCDSLAAAAASPVSMEATLVPSRTGLSCRGTEGPTRAARRAEASEGQQCTHGSSAVTTGQQALPCSARRDGDSLFPSLSQVRVKAQKPTASRHGGMGRSCS